MTVGGEISYYVRPVNGDDSNNGTSFASAWKTWKHAVDELCNTGVSAGDPNNAILFMVNETGDLGYTGPWHGPTGTESTLNYAFTSSGGRFQICGLSADGNYDVGTNFIFDLSGFTGTHWLNAFGSANMNNNGIQWRNITWRNGASPTDSIMYTAYDGELSGTEFYHCIFEDNELDSRLIGLGSYGDTTQYYDCIIRRNNTYGYQSLFPAGNYGPTTNRQPGALFTRCIFHDNQTDPSSFQHITGTNSLNGQGVAHEDCVFYNNGYDTSNIVCFLHAHTEQTYDRISNCIFFNNTGTALFLENAQSSDASYVTSVYGRKIFNNVFVNNNKAIEFEDEPGLRFSGFYNNLFYNNTSEDVPSYIQGMTGAGNNIVEDPQFTNGYSGDFSVPSDSPLYTKTLLNHGMPIGGYFVQKKEFSVTDEGSLSLGTGGVGDTVIVSGRSFQKVDDDPIVWRRV